MVAIYRSVSVSRFKKTFFFIPLTAKQKRNLADIKYEGFSFLLIHIFEMRNLGLEVHKSGLE